MNPRALLDSIASATPLETSLETSTRDVYRDATSSERLTADVSSDVPSGVLDKTAARFTALGIATNPSKPQLFRCVLPGHDHEARAWFDPRCRYWRYRCDGLDRELGLPTVRALRGGREIDGMKPVEAERWLERLDYEAGLLAPHRLVVGEPDRCPESAFELLGWMALYVSLRSEEHFALSDPFTFALSGFAEAYSGLTHDQVREGRKWLKDHGALRDTGEKIGAAILWKLAAQDPLPTDAAPVHERGSFGIEVGPDESVQPASELPDELAVGKAQAEVGGVADGLFAAGDRADGNRRRRHDLHATPLAGGGEDAPDWATDGDRDDPGWTEKEERDLAATQAEREAER